jgi:hypothetical protein
MVYVFLIFFLLNFKFPKTNNLLRLEPFSSSLLSKNIKIIICEMEFFLLYFMGMKFGFSY